MRRLPTIQKIRRWGVYALLAVVLMLPSVDRLHVTPARDVASEYVFSVVQWEITNFFGKWTHLLWESIPGKKPSREERLAIIDDYLLTSRLAQKEENQLEGRVARAGASRATGKGVSVSRETLEELRKEQSALRPEAEEAVEAELSAALVEEGFAWPLDVVFPPVDIKFGQMPTIIVTSRRDEIERLERVLLEPNIKGIDRGILEDEILEEYDLSAMVGNLAGLSTYPTLVSDQDAFRSVLRTSAHEWLHVYWFFRPFGQRFWSSQEMATLNETAADVAGRELGDATFAQMGGDLNDNARRFLPLQDRDPRFTEMMRETRRNAEELLADGRVQEAEEYLKERWWRLRLGGYGIRKLNQAYFALHGLYGESASAISPIGDEVAEFRRYFSTVGDFIRALSGVSSYSEFLNVLESKRADQT